MTGPGGMVLTYHAIEEGPPPLCMPLALFEHHVATLVEARATFLTVSELAGALRRGELPDRAVAITFDDGCASVLSNAAPVLARHGVAATVFAVSGHLGGSNDWPTQPDSAPRLELLGADDLAGLAGRGWEIGSHTVTHPPLAGLSPEALDRELCESRTALAATVDGPVTSFAYPYGSIPAGAAGALAAAGYDAGCGSTLERVDGGSDPLALPRLEMHYLRRPDRLRAVLARETTYLRLRRAGARARRRLAREGART